LAVVSVKHAAMDRKLATKMQFWTLTLSALTAMVAVLAVLTVKVGRCRADAEADDGDARDVQRQRRGAGDAFRVARLDEDDVAAVGHALAHCA
jgi:hypothetical protein